MNPSPHAATLAIHILFFLIVYHLNPERPCVADVRASHVLRSLVRFQAPMPLGKYGCPCKFSIADIH